MAREATPSRTAPAPLRPRPRLAAAAGVALAAAALCACNAISGVGDFSFDRSEFPDSAGGGGGAGGSGGAGGEGGLGVFTTSTSTGACDGTGECGDSAKGCMQCALQGPCAMEYQACGANSECVAFSDCLAMCMNAACMDQCAADHPAGVALYNEVTTCVVCGACYADCNGATSGCP